MKHKTFAEIIAASVFTAALTSCNFLNPGPVPENIVGDAPGELRDKIVEMLKVAGTDTSSVEFAEIKTGFLYRPGDCTADMALSIISPDDKNKMVQYTWSDMKDRRNAYDCFDLTVSTFGNDVIDTYEGFKDMIFTYDDIRPYLDNLPTYCKEALEASGYGEKGYVSMFSIDIDRVFISVSLKEQQTVSKTYDISEDGKHIEL